MADFTDTDNQLFFDDNDCFPSDADADDGFFYLSPTPESRCDFCDLDFVMIANTPFFYPLSIAKDRYSRDGFSVVLCDRR